MIRRPHVTHFTTVRTGLSLVFYEASVDQERQAYAYDAPDDRIPPPYRLGGCWRCHVGIQVTIDSVAERWRVKVEVVLSPFWYSVRARIIYGNNYGSDDGNVILKLFFLGPSTSICFLSNLFLTGPVLGSLQAHNQYPTLPPFFQRSLTISNPTTAINSCICVTER
jgi:hypothetical protein